MLLMCLTSCFAATVEIPGHNLYIQNGIEGQSYSFPYQMELDFALLLTVNNLM